MDVAKEWTYALGDRVGEGLETDEVLKARVNSAKAQQLARQEELDEIKHKREVARLTSETVKAEKEADGGAGQQGFRVTGGVNLGTIDYQEQQRLAKEENDRQRAENRQAVQALAADNDRLKDALHKTEIENTRTILMAQINQLGEAIKANMNQKSFADQYNEIKAAAMTLGITSPQAGGDVSIQLELKRLEFENQRELRRLNREEKQADRNFQLQLRQMDQKTAYDNQQVELQRERNHMLATFPATIGKVIAKGLMARGEEGEVAVGANPGRSPSYITANVGESGETDCPKCKAQVGVGATATKAVCAECGLEMSIKRIKEEANAPA